MQAQRPVRCRDALGPLGTGRVEPGSADRRGQPGSSQGSLGEPGGARRVDGPHGFSGILKALIDLQPLLDRLMSKDVGERFKNAAEAMRAIDGARAAWLTKGALV